MRDEREPFCGHPPGDTVARLHEAHYTGGLIDTLLVRQDRHIAHLADVDRYIPADLKDPPLVEPKPVAGYVR